MRNIARPCKSAKVLTDCSQTKAEIKQRIEIENKLKGNSDNITPPAYLTEVQKNIFNLIVEELKASDILSNLDVFILTTCAIAIDRLHQIEQMINDNMELMVDKALLSAKDKYTKDLFRCCNELSLSPQSRGKMANINQKAREQEEDKLLQILGGR